MTRDEFKEWFRHHSARFTGIRVWLDKMTKGADAPSEAEVLRAWYGTLCHVDLDAAKKASDAMHAGDGEVEEPTGYDRHPRAIRKACGTARRQSSDNAPRYDADGNQMFEC